MKNAENRKIGKALYFFSLFIWLLNILFIAIQFFTEIPLFWVAGIFLAVIFEGFASGAFSDKDDITYTLTQKRALDYFLDISKIISIICTAVSGIALLIAGGGPEIINKAYYIVNHGEIVNSISSRWFLVLSIFETLLFGCAILIFSTFMAIRIRILFLSHSEHKA